MKRIIIPLLLLTAGCGGPAKRAQSPQAECIEMATATSESKVSGSEQAHFRPALPPAELEGEAQRAYLREHFWDHFDFADSTLLVRIDSAEMVQAYIAYVGAILKPDDGAAMAKLMAKADCSKAMLDYFHKLGQKLLYDPNSPLRSDELYLPVLEQVVASPHYSEYEKLSPAYELALVRQNRVGSVANDFRYTLADGSSGRLHTLKASYTLLFFSNPGCPMCQTILQEIGASPLLSELIERGELRVLKLYPDADLEAWKAHRAEVPASWLDGYDKGCIIQQERLYDLKAIPSLYLLDREKRVICKDEVDVERIEEALLMRQ